MKKALLIFLVLLLLGILMACSSNRTGWGSFTAEKTESYDQKYYALQKYADNSVVVTVYDTATNAEIYSFSPARASDFWGICWEKNSYNIWIQSGDIGILCYRYENGSWTLDKQAERPADIRSKYDG